jgi:PncC family amidohydrolase
LGGIIAYSNQVKEALLGVQKRTLEEKGAVSKHTALEMAQGAKRALGAEMGISVTGIAGPTGGTQEKPVGLTWIAVSTPFHERAESYHWNGNRQENKALSAEAALALALKTLEQAHA